MTTDTNKRVLIVEDDVDLLNLYREVLTKEGYILDLAEDGNEALQKADVFQPDIVLLDLMLPYVDGFTVLEQLKASPKTEHCFVIVQTNLDSETQRQKAKNLGANHFLVKSEGNPGSLVEEIKKLISSK